MKNLSKHFLLILAFVLTVLLLNGCAGTTPKPVGELNKEEVIKRYFKDRSLDDIEGIWVREDNSFEIAVLKNSFNIFPGYDYVGIVTDSNKVEWGIGETKLLIKKTSNRQRYSVSYFDDHAKVTKSQNKTDMTLVGDNIAKIDRTNYVLIKNYPQPEEFCWIGFEYSNPNLLLKVISPYARIAGLLPGDKLIAINGEQVLTGKDVSSKIAKKKAGDRIKIAVKRNQQTIEVEAVCRDSNKMQQGLTEIFIAEGQGKWDECISKSYEAEQEWGKSSNLSGIRLDCAEKKRLEDNRMPNLYSAELFYEYRRRMIAEAVYSQEDLELIRSDVLRARSWLESNNFHAFADDLSKQWDTAIKSEILRSAPIGTGSKSFGTGFIVSPDGFVLTAYHVVENAKSIKVVFQDGRSFETSIQQSSKSTDLAVLRVSALTPNYLPLVPTKTSKVGEPIFTMGFPVEEILGKEPKFTDGTISALSGIGGEATFFQMSVPVQPGNSGGPVANNRGEAIGIVTSTAAILPFLSTTGTLPQNINWAVKSDYAIPLLNSPPQLPPSTNREAAIERVRSALCAIEATMGE